MGEHVFIFLSWSVAHLLHSTRRCQLPNNWPPHSVLKDAPAPPPSPFCFSHHRFDFATYVGDVRTYIHTPPVKTTRRVEGDLPVPRGGQERDAPLALPRRALQPAGGGVAAVFSSWGRRWFRAGSCCPGRGGGAGRPVVPAGTYVCRLVQFPPFGPPAAAERSFLRGGWNVWIGRGGVTQLFFWCGCCFCHA